MSYLLEALKRLEERRQDGEKSDLLIVDVATRRETKKRMIWPYVLSAALLANAGVGVWWLRASRTPPVTAQAPRRVIQEDAAARAPQVPVVPQSLSGNGTGAGRASNGLSGAASIGTRPEAAASSTEAIRTGGGAPLTGTPKPPVTGPSPHSAPPSSSPQSLPLTGVTEGRKGPTVPSSPDNDLSEIRLSLHSYSTDPKSRLVRIDDKTLHEGETLSTGAVVEEITPDGVILNDKGSRIHLRVKE
jgi:general secretion pathway protein B